jgi:hypothetical protein
MVQLLAYVVFFGEEHVLFQLSWIGLFGANAPYLPLETPKIQEVFLSKTNTILTGKQCASNMDGFLLRDTCVSST